MAGQSRQIFPGPWSPGLISGPLLVWNGQERLATVSTNAGSWRHGPGWNGKGSPDQGGELKNMFDENPRSFWHSAKHFQDETKIVRIDFKVRLGLEVPTNKIFQKPINFHLIMIRKRMDYHPDITKRYFNVCLVLNSDTEQGSKIGRIQ